MGLFRRLEHRVEKTFEGGFGKAFKSNVQPVELARKLAREMDDSKTISVSRVYVPNIYTVYLSPKDREQFATYEASLRTELAGYLADHARRQGYTVPGKLRVLLETAAELKVGTFGIAVLLSEDPVLPEEPVPPAGRGARRVQRTPGQSGGASAAPAVPPVPDRSAPAVPSSAVPAPGPAAPPSPAVPASPVPAADPVEASAVPAADAVPAPDVLPVADPVPDVAPAPAASSGAAVAPEGSRAAESDRLPPEFSESSSDHAFPPDLVERPEPARPDPAAYDLDADDGAVLGASGVAAPAAEPPPVAPSPRRRSGAAPSRRTEPVPVDLAADAAYGVEDPEPSRSWLLSWPGGSYVVDRRAIVIGRSRDCDVVLADGNVSRRHAELIRQSSMFLIRDLDSTNGVAVNGRRVREAAVAAGDVITIGATTITLERKR